MDSPLNSSEYFFESRDSLDDYYSSNEQFKAWFLGSLMLYRKNFEIKYNRLNSLHNRITHENTKFDERYKAYKRIASQLSEFFPKRWLLEITDSFRNLNSDNLGIISEEDRICSYLGYIEIYLTFRGLTILESTIREINRNLSINLTKNNICSWKLKLITIIPGLKDQWKKIRAPKHQRVIKKSVIKVMNKELQLTSYSQKEIFEIKQTALKITRDFALIPKTKHIKNIETWALAICLKALRECKFESSCTIFPNFPAKFQKSIENKRWQLDKLLD